MSIKKIIFVQLINYTKAGHSERCDEIDSKRLFLITFGSGQNQYANKTPFDFDFLTNYPQKFAHYVDPDHIGFINSIPIHSNWHSEAEDHTVDPNSVGYMYFVNVGENGSLIFNRTLSNLCIGEWYTFSAYLANVEKPSGGIKPNVRFEVRAALDQNQLIAENITGDIPAYNNMTWTKYTLSFNVSTSSIFLLMFSNAKNGGRNDLAIDDIEVRVCSIEHTGYCSSNEFQMCSNTTIINDEPIFLLTFDANSNECNGPCHKNLSAILNSESGSLITAISNHSPWHIGALDHTFNDDINGSNVCSQSYNYPKPNIRFEVRAANNNELHACSSVKTSYSSTTTGTSTKLFLKPPQCKNSSVTGINCSVPNNPCHHLKPCLNNATCANTHNGYKCTCLPGFNGTKCQYNQRICKQFACFNHDIHVFFILKNNILRYLSLGKCNNTFHCICNEGWQGIHCQTKINFCIHHRCQNNAVCRSSIQNYTYECLGNYYYGKYCEQMTTKVIILKIVSKSFSYIGILAIAIVVIFVLVMDILKYCFGIDPVEEEREHMRREKRQKKANISNRKKNSSICC